MEADTSEIAMATLDPLANPKGVIRLCELCQKPAHIQCTKCRVTFYCGIEHQNVDFIGIHAKVCQLLIPLRTSVSFATSDEERLQRKEQQLKQKVMLVELTRTTGRKLLFENKYAEAIPAALLSLRLAVDLYGLASVELVPSYLILGRASIGLGRLQQAEEYLLQARWTVLKTEGSSNKIKHKLCRHLGLLYASKGQFDEALRELADDIFYASEEYGTCHIHTAGGYFHMGNIFYQQGNIATATSLFEEVTDIWHQHLWKLVQSRLDECKVTGGIDSSTVDVKTVDELDESEKAEALQVFTSILNLWEHHILQKSDSFAKIAHTLAMLYFILEDIGKAKEFGRRAVGSSGLVQDEDFTRNMVEFLKMCENVKVLVE